jgi:phosphatidylinositol alpha-1,6-mannosyltransferase
MAPVESKRRILLVTNDLGPHSGGIETFLLGLINELPGNEIVILTSNEAGSEAFDKELTSNTGVKIIRDRSKMLLPTPRVTKKAISIAKQYESEVVWFGAAAPLAMMAEKLKKNGIKKAVAISHGHEVWWAKVPIFNLAMRKIGNGCDVVTYLGPFTRDAIKNSLGSHPKLIQIAPGISVDQFKPGQKPVDLISKYGLDGHPVIVTVGRLVKRKGQDKLIEALPFVKREIPNIKLVFVGEGSIRKNLEKKVKQLGLQENVIFVGRVPYKDLPNHFLLGDIFAMPSRSRLFGLEVEGLGIVYLEASSSGLPVLGGNSGGAPDAVKVNETGYVADGNSPEDIANYAIKLLNDSQLRAAFGKNGREWAQDYWTWKIWAKKFAELLEI